MKIIVTEYDKNWISLFEVEADKIREVFQDDLIDIHHIGSTSVPHLKAKPIIDIMPVVKEIERVDLHNEAMIELGYEPLGEFGIQGRRYFRKGGGNRTHHIHIFQKRNDLAIERHLAVRDYLRTHPKKAAEYGELKAKLAKQFPLNNEGYCDGKDKFVQHLEQQALKWMQDNQR